jgi:signal transduction histidine kinase
MSANLRPTQIALYTAGAGMALFTPFAALASLEVVLCQLVWAAMSTVGAWSLGRVSTGAAQRLAVAIALLIPAVYGPVVVLTGGASAPTFAWVVAMPLGLVVIFRAHDRAVIAGALSTLAVAVMVCGHDQLPAPLFMLRVMQVGVAGALAVVGARAFSYSARRERVAVEAREATAKALSDSELRRERAERTLYLVKLSKALAHEVNNPLAFLKANIQFLQDTKTTEEDRVLLADALLGVERIRDVIDELRELSGQTALPVSNAELDAKAARKANRAHAALPRI